MKKASCLIYFVLIFGVMSQAQQKEKPQLPNVNLEKFMPPANKSKSNKASQKDKKKNIPKVDLSNFKPPVHKRSEEEHN